LIGLTATPGRGLDQNIENSKLASFFDKNLIGPDFSCNPIRELQNRGILAQVRHRSIDSSVEVALSNAERAAASEVDLPGAVLDRLAKSSVRNRRIINLVMEEVGAGRSCLLFACTTEHSRVLSAAFNILGVKSAHVDAGVSNRRRNHIISDFRLGTVKVLCNFGVLSTGLDVPLVSSVIITRPTTSIVLYSQMVGRAIRGLKAGGNERAEVVTLVDTGLPGFGDLGAAFNNWEDVW
jgi:superfamily II DNA or RNA helicase